MNYSIYDLHVGDTLERVKDHRRAKIVEVRPPSHSRQHNLYLIKDEAGHRFFVNTYQINTDHVSFAEFWNVIALKGITP